MYYIANNILHNQADAEDVVHDAFVTLCNNLDKVDPGFGKKTWSYVAIIVKNKAINLYNKKKRQAQVVENREIWEMQEVFDTGLEERVLRKEQQDLMTALLMEMREPYRSVMILQYYHGLSAEEIGAQLGRPRIISAILLCERNGS